MDKELLMHISNKNNDSMTDEQKQCFKDITQEFFKDADPKNNNGVHLAKSITKDGVTFRVNKKNKIIIKNKEKENAYWFLQLMGGKINLLPEIHSKESITMADYKYFPIKGKGYFIENKEMILQKGQVKVGINNISHKLEESKNQSEVYIIDVTGGNLNENEVLESLHVVFRNKRLKNKRKILIIKNNDDLFGVFTDI